MGSPVSNNFDGLRLLAAALVLYSHQQVLGGWEEGQWLGQRLGPIGVQVFFAISGFLIYRSWQNDPRLLPYLFKRFLRIWPGLVVMVLVTLLVLGPLVTQVPLREYFHAEQTWAYLRALKVFELGGPLPGVFQGLPQDGVVNASLWTLPIEVRWYLILAAIGVVGLLNRAITLPVIFVGIFLAVHVLHEGSAPSNTLLLGLSFLIGALLQQTHALWRDRHQVLPALAACSLLVTWAGAPDYWVTTFFFPVMAVWVGHLSTPVLRRAGRFGDFSYGAYIYAFPIQQAVIQFGVNQRGWSFIEGLVCAMLVTCACALASWHAVEKPALKLKRYVAAAG